MAITVIVLAALVGFILRLLKVHIIVAWFVGCAIVPSYILFAEFVLPYQGGGASMWPIALFFGGLYGAIASGVGVFLARFIKKNKEKA